MLGRVAGCAAILAWIAATPAQAQDHPSAAPAAERVEFVKTGLFMVTGDGANTAVRLSGNGIILVDGKLPGHYTTLIARVHGIADELPVRLLVLTGPEDQRTGTNGDFLKAGVPVMAQEHTKEILARSPKMDGQPEPPSVTFDAERTIGLGGVTVKLLHFGAARTSGDAVAYFPDLKVVAVGDLYTSAMPDVDDADGGSLAGWGAALRKILQLDFDTVLPGTGPIVRRPELEALADHIDKLLAAQGAH